MREARPSHGPSRLPEWAWKLAELVLVAGGVGIGLTTLLFSIPVTQKQLEFAAAQNAALQAQIDEQRQQDYIARRAELYATLYDRADNCDRNDPQRVCPVKADIRSREEAIKALIHIERQHHARPSLRSLDLSGESLSRVDLAGVDLSEAKLNGAKLASAHLEQAILTEAHLNAVNLSNADLEGANFWGADLDDANLTHAHLESANLTNASLKRADLTRAHLRGAQLTLAHLELAKLGGADLQLAVMRGAHLEGADLETHSQAAVLSSADSFLRLFADDSEYLQEFNSELSRDLETDMRAIVRRAGLNYGDRRKLKAVLVERRTVDLRGVGADLRRADLSMANLAGASVGLADFEGATLSGADLQGSSITQAQLGRAIFDGATRIPELSGSEVKRWCE